MTKTSQYKKPPIFSSRQEEAEFWDTHDITEYATSNKPLPIKYQLKPSKGITVRFREDDLEELRQFAYTKRIGVTTLIRLAALEFIREHNKSVV